MIYNYAHGTWYAPRDLPQVNAGDFGGTVSAGAFSDQNRAVNFAGQQRALIRADMGTSFLVPGTNTYAAGPINAFVERTHLEFSKDIVDRSKFVEDIYFRITGSGSVNVITRPTGSPGETVDFTMTRNQDGQIRRDTFDISRDYKVSPRVNGRYFNIQVGSNDMDNTWELVDYTLDFNADDIGTG